MVPADITRAMTLDRSYPSYDEKKTYPKKRYHAGLLV